MNKIKLVASAAILLALGACNRDQKEVTDPIPPNESELITTVTLHFHEKGNHDNHAEASFKDIDGAGGEDAVVDSIILDTNTTYEMSIELKDESQTTVVDITSEIQEEAAEHIFCFDAPSNVNVTITDNDGTHPIGLTSEWVTTAYGSGKVKVTLKHQPEVKDGTCTPGETDVEVDFNLTVQ